MSKELSNNRLLGWITLESVIGLVMGVIAVSTSYAITAYRVGEAENSIRLLQGDVKGEQASIYQVKSDLRDIKTNQENFEREVFIHLDYQKDELKEIKHILKEG